MKERLSVLLASVLVIGLVSMPARADAAKKIRKQLKAKGLW